jgi:hypothetical protein
MNPIDAKFMREHFTIVHVGQAPRRPFTQNPATPHPDADNYREPLPLGDAIAWAIKTLRDPAADQWAKTWAADELTIAWDNHEENQL